MMSSTTLALQWASASSWYQRAVLRVLGRMDRGRLNLTLPSGEVLAFGAEGDPGHAAAANIRVLSPKFFRRCTLYGDIGFGESYSAGEWETDDLVQVIRWMILNHEHNPAISGGAVSGASIGLLRGVNELVHALRDNDPQGSVRNIAAHYDLSNELFACFLDESMSYSCADFSGGAQTLEEAQRAKLDRLAAAMRLRPSDRVLEIGGGWGGLALHLARRYGCHVTTITISREQLKLMHERIAAAGLADRIEARFQDYRSIQGQFDKVIAVEMLEAVGHRHLPTFFAAVERVLSPQGLLAVQVISAADSRYDEIRRRADWTQKHIFPGSLIPSLAVLTAAAKRGSRLQMHSLYDMGADYAKTLKEWRRRFHQNLETVRRLRFDERFIRTWNYYFAYCEAAFAARHISAAQIVYTRPNNLSLS